MIPVETLRPFTRAIMTIGQIPTSYLISMSYEEQLLWFCNYLEKTVIPALDNNAEALKEVQELYKELKSYVDNYFENLDIQEEIDNKLDEMASSGQLTDIIAQYLELAGVLAYNTKANLKSASNIANGSICKTLGETTYNDGKGAFYKIRTLTSGDTIDDNNILALSNYPTLIAEKMPDYRLNELESRVSDIEDELEGEKIVFFGDSYARGSLGGGELTDSWCVRVANMLGLSSSDYYSNGVSGGAFYNGTLNSGFDTFLATIPVAFRNKTTKVVIGAGANDFVVPSATTTITNYIYDLIDTIKLNFPKAKIYLCLIGYKNIMDATYAQVRSGFINNILNSYMNCINKGVSFAGDIGYILHDNTMISETDGTHPTEQGYAFISKAIYNFITCGKSFIKPIYRSFDITPMSGMTLTANINVSMLDEVTNVVGTELTLSSDSSIGTNSVGVLQIGTNDNPPCVRPTGTTTLIAGGTALITHQDNSTEVQEVGLRIGYNGAIYLVFSKQISSIKSIRTRALFGSLPTGTM